MPSPSLLSAMDGFICSSRRLLAMPAAVANRFEPSLGGKVGQHPHPVVKKDLPCCIPLTGAHYLPSAAPGVVETCQIPALSSPNTPEFNSLLMAGGAVCGSRDSAVDPNPLKMIQSLLPIPAGFRGKPGKFCPCLLTQIIVVG